MSVVLTSAQLDRLSALSKRDHNGEVVIEPVEHDGLALLADMGDVPPLHTFLLSPRGVLRPA